MNNLVRLLVPSLLFFFLLLISGGPQPTESTTGSTTEPDSDNVSVNTISLENKLSLTYGSLLNADCMTNDDCILKNSICNSYTKRCECDYNAVHTDNRCQTLRCTTNDDCRSRFDNTICVFGSCRCKLGLSANGRCVDLDLPGLGSRSMPDWAITLIAVGALISGVYGGRSQFISQFLRQLLSIVLLVLRVFAMNNNNNNNRNNNGNGSSNVDPQQQIIDELSAVMTNNSFDNNIDLVNNNSSQNDKRKQSGQIPDSSISTKKSTTTNNNNKDEAQLI